MKRRKQQCMVCPDCKGTGEDRDYPITFAQCDDATAVLSPYPNQMSTSICSPEAYGDDDIYDCTRCGGEGVVYEKLSFVDNFYYGLQEQADFVTEEFLEQFINIKDGIAY